MLSQASDKGSDTLPAPMQLKIMDAVESRVYPIDVLHYLRETLPYLKCDLRKFTANAWRAQLIRPPKDVKGNVVFPADFPRLGRQKISKIPDQRLYPRRKAEKTIKKVSFALDKPELELEPLPPRNKAGKGRPVPPPIVLPPSYAAQRDAGFEHFLETVPSPTHKRVTAGGRVIPAEPGSVSPVAGKTTFSPTLLDSDEANPVLVGSGPGYAPMLYQPIGSVGTLAHQSFIQPITGVGVPASIPYQNVVPSLTNSTNLTNRMRELSIVDGLQNRLRTLLERAQAIGQRLMSPTPLPKEQTVVLLQEYEPLLEQIEKIQMEIREMRYKQAEELQEQSLQSRLTRTRGAGLNATSKNNPQPQWPAGSLMSDPAAFVAYASASRITDVIGSNYLYTQVLPRSHELHHFVPLENRNPMGQSMSSTAPAPRCQNIVGDGPWIHGPLPGCSGGKKETAPTKLDVPLTNRKNRQGSSNQPRGRRYYDLDGAASSVDEQSDKAVTEAVSESFQNFRELSSTSSRIEENDARTDVSSSPFASIDAYFNKHLPKKPGRGDSVQTTRTNSTTQVTLNSCSNSRREGTDSIHSSKDHISVWNPFKSAPSVSIFSAEGKVGSTGNNLNKLKNPITDTHPAVEPAFGEGNIGKAKRGEPSAVASAEATLRKIHNKQEAKPKESAHPDTVQAQSTTGSDRQKDFLGALLKHPRSSAGEARSAPSGEAAGGALEDREGSSGLVQKGAELGSPSGPASTSATTDQHGQANSASAGPDYSVRADRHQPGGMSPRSQQIYDKQLAAFFDSLEREEDAAIAKYQMENPL